ncbi:MAG: metallophosphatase domain-containing protein [Granulosicoccus sp.]
MRLVCISDTHGDHEGLELPAGDVLIHAGDLSAHGSRDETLAFMKWLGSRGFNDTLCIAGNHDTFMEADPEMARQFAEDHGVLLLSDSGCQLDGRQFWGSPITPRFCNWSFMRDPGEPIEAHWRLIPDDTDVLITHGPPYGIMDQVKRPDGQLERTGCPSLLERVQSISPVTHIFGHIHEGRGSFSQNGVTYFNVCTMNEHYQRTYEPVVIDLT